MERDIISIEYRNFIVYFNSHAHVERDYFISMLCEYRAISTHTLTWSVTWASVLLYEQHKNFNSHAHVERDP